MDLPDQVDHALQALWRGDSAAFQRLLAAGGGTSIDDMCRGLMSARYQPEAPLHPGEEIEGFRIIRELGRGGMGVVYAAEQQHPRRLVALKLIRPGVASEGMFRRFEHEVRLLARLQHPGIAQLFGAGALQTAAGPQPYFVMEFVEGIRLSDYARERGLSGKQRLELFCKVCDAVQHAHQRGVIHRDLKPANILVVDECDQSTGDCEQRPGAVPDSRLKVAAPSGFPARAAQPKILDFGLARATERDGATTLETLAGQLVGTLPYMSPEQVAGEPGETDTRSDVYSLGVVLYELLCDRLPHDFANCPVLEAARRIREEPPVRLSSVRPSLRGEIETIVAKAIEKDRSRRYQSAAALAEDIRRHARGEPIEARGDRGGYLLRKMLWRYRGAVAVASAFVLLLGAGLTTSLTLWRWALTAQRETQQVADFQAEQLSGIDIAGMGARLKQDLLDEAMSAMKRAGLSAQEIEQRGDAFEQALSGANLTNVALKQLDHDIFARALDATERFDDQPLVKAQLLQTLADTLVTLGLLDRATAPQDEALTIRRRVLGGEHEQTLISINHMGDLLAAQGKPSEAEAFYREALEKRRRVLGEEHPATLTSIHNLGPVLRAQGKLAEAEGYYREALEKRRRVLGEDHPHTLLSTNNLGILLQAQGKLTEAEGYYRKALETRRRVMGEDHPDTLIAISNMGYLLYAQGKLDEAEPYWREAVDKHRRVRGDEHPATLKSIHNLGSLLRAEGKLAEAEVFCREAFEKVPRVLGPDHPLTSSVIGSMGSVLKAQGKLAEAEGYYRAALETRRRVLGHEHPDTLHAVSGLGVLLQARGELAEAERYCREALEKGQQVLGDEHPDTLEWLDNLASVLLALGKFAEAEALLLPAVQAAQETVQAAHPVHAELLERMAVLCEARHAATPEQGFDAQAAEWRAKLGAAQTTTQPESAQPKSGPPQS